jgi:hypothetical protein
LMETVSYSRGAAVGAAGCVFCVVLGICIGCVDNCGLKKDEPRLLLISVDNN